jgi:hypothetical protein
LSREGAVEAKFVVPPPPPLLLLLFAVRKFFRAFESCE